MPRISYQQIQQNIAEIANRETYDSSFIYDLLLAYGKPKATVTKLTKGVNNFAEDGVLLKDAVFFKVFPAGTVLESKVEQLKSHELTEKYRPRFLIATDLQRIAAYDRRQESSLSTKIRDLDKDFTFFYGLSGNEVNTDSKEEAYADRKAAENMKALHDEIEKCNSQRIIDGDTNFSHDLNIFFSRLLFCFFAEDTDLFGPKQFTNAVKNYTKMDGSDLPYFFEQLFKSLDSKPYEKQDMPDPFNKFPYVNGTIFDTKKHSIAIPDFNATARHLLIQLAESNWSDVNPDIFGTIFQGIVDAKKRDENGMDYTSVTNIEKVINPLFMDELWEEYEKSKDNTKKLLKLWNRISQIKIFDPACGSGNFLIIAFKRLRELEQEIIRTIDEITPAGIGIKLNSEIKLDHFFGIEIEDFPRELAVLSMYIAAHQMNIKFEEEFGKKLTIIPIIDMPTIIHGNSARLDWNSVCPNLPKNKSLIDPESQMAFFDVEDQPSMSTVEYDEIYVIGNPPYKGSRGQNSTQKQDMDMILSKIDGYKYLDYIAIWFEKLNRYIKGTFAKGAFVSTNSICQGDQAGIFWPHIFENGIGIQFAYTSFKWTNNAKNVAGVMVCIISLSNIEQIRKRILFTKETSSVVNTINAYLYDGGDNVVLKSRDNLNGFPEMVKGSTCTDGDFLSLTRAEKDEILSESPLASAYIKKYVGSSEFINNIERYCLWIDDSEWEKAKAINAIKNRVESVREFRLNEENSSTQAMAMKPWSFFRRSYKPTDAIIVPVVSSERREYIPMGYVDKDTIISYAAFAIYEAEPWLLALLESKMHTAWIRTVCGKLKTDYRYSSSLGYNTFPVPPLKPEQKEALNDSAMNILMARENHTEMTLAQMYDPDKMPEDLREAHDKNDLLVDSLYQSKAFASDEERLAKLFAMYEDMTKDEK